MAEFVHLHCHTEYSLLDGAIRIKDLCARAKDFGMPAAAITDHGNMHGAAEFYRSCKDFGLKPIIGCEVYVCHDHRDKESDMARRRHHLVLLAQNAAGYRNLIKLVTQGFLEGFHYRPRVDMGLLRQHAEGLIALSACMAGEIPHALLHKGMDEALRLAGEYSAVFPQRFYLELQSNGLKAQADVNAGLMELAQRSGLPLVATNDCHYLDADDVEAHDILLCIQTQTRVDDPKRMRFETTELYYKSIEEMERAFAPVPEALANTLRIAEQCALEIPFGRHVFPVYALPEGVTLEDEFRRLAEDGLEKRLAQHPDRGVLDHDLYRKRLAWELQVITEMKFPAYFLIVQDFINWAKDNGIPVGPGRGSAAGSLVAWALRITNLDPIPYKLLFERFLNNERVSLPDIDVDFCERRRPEVMRYVAGKYGKDAVAQITTFGTMKAKAVVRDVGRALGLAFPETDKIAKLVPDDLKMTLARALEAEPALAELYANDPQVRRLLDISRRLEGLARHASTHAAGVVIADGPMHEYLPLYRGKNGEIVTQFDMKMVEKVGLMKFDFLGLRTMTLIQDTLDAIARQGKQAPDLDALPLTDAATYEVYARGDTDGVFQVESAGMRQYLRMLKPNCFEDLIAMLALYRPGTLRARMAEGNGVVEGFIKRKHGELPVTYPLPLLEDCLRDTYGVIVYQEQVMQIAQLVAGYSLGQADILRSAMGKKKAEVMAQERTHFMDGARAKGIDEKKAEEIFNLMEKFAEYGFNKSHSAAYALISYHTAYLKTHFKVEFMAALLTSEMGNQDKLSKYVAVCKDMDIQVVPPSVNRSRREFTAHDGRVVFGLGGIKNVGSEAIHEIVGAREKGEFTSLLDLVVRVNPRKATRRVFEALIKGGACDCFGISRAALLAGLEPVMVRAQKRAKELSSNQVSLLSAASIPQAPSPGGLGFACEERDMPEMEDVQRLAMEKEALGFFLTSHPLQPYRREMDRLGLTPLEEARDLPAGAEIRCAVLVTQIKEVVTKAKGERMAFVGVEDLSAHAEITFFPRMYPEARDILKSEEPLEITARLDSRGEAPGPDEDEEEGAREIKLLGQSARLLSEVCAGSDMPLNIAIPSTHLDAEHMRALAQVL
ncbi:MAG: DNA polymerase III subunit alpha, partial [Deltaproteobacteria bacterium]|nr:DNA polymerase III subunit alpha [Deltaproteobacteria bacterium]